MITQPMLRHMARAVHMDRFSTDDVRVDEPGPSPFMDLRRDYRYGMSRVALRPKLDDMPPRLR